MVLSVEVKNETLGEKILKILEIFSTDGVDVKVVEENSDNKILENFRDGLRELKSIQNGNDSSRDVEDFLNEL